MKILNPQHNKGQLSDGNIGSISQSRLTPNNQFILDRLKEQQQLRLQQKQLEKQERLYASEPVVQGDLVPASDQYMRSQDIRQQSQRTLNESKNLIHQNQNQQKQMMGLGNSRSNGMNASNLSGETAVKDHLLVMTIDLGDGNCDILHIYELDDPFRKAEVFCHKHGLTKEAQEILAKNIEVNKQIVITERQHSLYHSTTHVRGTSPQYSTQQDNYYASPQQQAIRSNYYKSPSSNAQIENSSEQIQHQQNQIQDAQSYPVTADNTLELQQHQNLYLSQPVPHHQSHEEHELQQEHEDQDLDQEQEQDPDMQNEDYQVIHPNQKESIFDRLYGEAKQKKQRIEQKKQQQLEQSSHLNSTYRSTKRVVGNSVVELGNYLYMKGEEMKEKKENRIREQQYLRQKEQEKELSFVPELDPNSVRIALNRRQDQGSKAEDTLIKLGQLYKEKKDIKKSERENEQLQECTFKPEVNPVSTYLYEMKQKESGDYPYEGKFDKLHKEYIKRNQRQQEDRGLYDQCTFHPKINRPPKVQDQLNVVDRMMKFANEKEKKIQELKIKQQLEQQQEDQSTFQPQIGRPPVGRNTNNLSVHDYLYMKKEEKKIRQEMLTKKEEDETKKSQVTSLDKSNKIVENIKKQRLFEIFQSLDSDGDGQISSQNIDIQFIPDYVIKVIAPLLCAMEQNNFIFGFESFYEYSMKLISMLSIAQKDEFFNNQKIKWEEKKAKYEQHDYKPEINQRSQKLANKRSYEKFEGLYSHGMAQKQNQQEKISKQKEEIAQRELDECSFKPQLFKPMNIYPFTDPKIQAEENNFFGIQQNGFELGDGQFRVTGIVHNAPTTNSIQQ